MGDPKKIKTHDDPGYTSGSFQRFLQQLDVSYSTGIPYNPQGQAIVMYGHLTLKWQI